MNDMELVRFTAWVSAGAVLMGAMGTATAETVLIAHSIQSRGLKEKREIGVERVSIENGVIVTSVNVTIMQRGR